VALVVVLDHRDAGVAARIRDLQRASYRVEADLIGFDKMPPLLEDVEDIARLKLTVLGAVERHEVLGVLGYSRDDGIVDIDRLAVDPTHFRRGVGRMLLDALHRRESDADRFEVSTGADNEPAIGLYRVMGYEPTHGEISAGVNLVHLARLG
jgi:ribosomal protein S18 acetylase RimI-like enzyme